MKTESRQRHMFWLPGSHPSTCGGSKQMTELSTTHSETCNFVLKLILMHLFTSLQVHSSAFPNTDTPLVCCSLMLLFFTYLLFYFRLRGKYTVAVVTGNNLASVQQKAAEDFIQSRLYGPGSCRTTSKEEPIMAQGLQKEAFL